MNLRDHLVKVKEAAMAMALIKTEDKNEALEEFAQLIESHKDFILSENKKDLDAAKGKISENLLNRLKLDESKIKSISQGLRDLIGLEDLIGKVQLSRELDKNLILERVTVPLGVVGVIFESRPDVIPQILSLILKSGNAAVLKGGSEAQHSNKAFMNLVEKLNTKFTFFPNEWATLVGGREDVTEMLKHHDLIDLMIPRGSNELVKMIKNSTKIPVLGHADGVCHLYIHENANLKSAVQIARDSKIQSPSACNALETLLVDKKVAENFLKTFVQESPDIKMIGCERTQKILPQVVAASEEDWRSEYGDLRLSVKIVDDIQSAIEHINTYGSHHTDGIVTENAFILEIFLNAIDSACVFSNASTRFADGFRFGFGAEIGISTEKIHARGPVGIEGLVTYKYKLRGQGQVVADYVGSNAKKFSHRDLSK